MLKIISIDSYNLNHSAEKVFNAVADVSVYKDWWSFVPRLLSNFINISKIHSNAMKEMFASLDRYLSSQ